MFLDPWTTCKTGVNIVKIKSESEIVVIVAN